MDAPSVRIILADDHQIFIEGLKVVLKNSEGLNCDIVGETNSGTTVLKLAAQIEADVLLLDMNMPDMNGLEVMSHLKQQSCPFKIIVLSMYDEPKIVKAAFRAGVDGYLMKRNSIKELFKAIKAVLDGETYLGFGLSLTNGSGMHTRFLSHGKLSVSYDDRFLKKFNLTRREMEVLKLIGKALSNKEISKELYISDQTASVHRKNIMRKLGVSSSATLIKMAFENNLL